jgi:co-chaperonin GroES (HSP10)
MNLKHVIGTRVAVKPESLAKEVGGVHFAESSIEVRKVGVVTALGTDIDDKHGIKVNSKILYSKAAQDLFLDSDTGKVEIVDVRHIYAIID